MKIKATTIAKNGRRSSKAEKKVKIGPYKTSSE